MVPVKLRRAKSEDANAIVDLFREIADKELDVKKIAVCVEKYPSILVLSGDTLVGFVYSSSFAPDILELLNIAVLESYRGFGIGSMMLNEVEKQASQQYRAVILVNSVLYPSKKPKKPASNFYIKNGYNIVHATGSTNVFIKSLA
jgi:ribosomal protein S18 acetylase RimI-like enzyme